jgi:hypothetical protein
LRGGSFLIVPATITGRKELATSREKMCPAALFMRGESRLEKHRVSKGGGVMAYETSPAHSRRAECGDGGPDRREIGADTEAEIGALRAENAELRKVVIALSRLVIRNVLRNEAGL